jgi:hypothetical protein
VRHAPFRSARPSPPDDTRLSRGGHGAPCPGARGGRRALGRDGRRWVPVGPRGPSRVDAVLRRDGGCRAPRRDPGVVDRADRVRAAGRGAGHVLRTLPRARRRCARWVRRAPPPRW